MNAGHALPRWLYVELQIASALFDGISDELETVYREY